MRLSSRPEAQPRVVQALHELDQLVAHAVGAPAACRSPRSPQWRWRACGRARPDRRRLGRSRWPPRPAPGTAPAHHHSEARRRAARAPAPAADHRPGGLPLRPQAPARARSRPRRWSGGDPSPAVGQHRAAEPVRVAELLGELCGVEQRLAKLGVADLALGLPQADQQLAAFRALAARAPGRRARVPGDTSAPPHRGRAASSARSAARRA